MLGKYAGLVMTLARQPVGDDARLLRRAVPIRISPHSDGLRAGWEAPAVDPRLLVAIVLIFAELMLVTALALFFSTYSSPLLATLLTLGLWVAGHFNADLRNFGDRRRFAAAADLVARASIT